MEDAVEHGSFLFKFLREDERSSETVEIGADEEISLSFFQSKSSESNSSGITFSVSEFFKVTKVLDLVSSSLVKVEEGEEEEEEEGFKKDSEEDLKKDVMEGVLETGSKHFSPSFLEKLTNLLTSQDRRPVSLG